VLYRDVPDLKRQCSDTALVALVLARLKAKGALPRIEKMLEGASEADRATLEEAVDLLR
jgi:hypothetical protein